MRAAPDAPLGAIAPPPLRIAFQDAGAEIESFALAFYEAGSRRLVFMPEPSRNMQLFGSLYPEAERPAPPPAHTRPF